MALRRILRASTPWHHVFHGSRRARSSRRHHFRSHPGGVCKIISQVRKALGGLTLSSLFRRSDSELSCRGVEKRAPVSHIHPLIRTHPVTGKKGIFLNRPFVRRIVELKEQESDYLLNFLYTHIEQAHDLQLRTRWVPKSVVVWTTEEFFTRWSSTGTRLCLDTPLELLLRPKDLSRTCICIPTWMSKVYKMSCDIRLILE